MIPVCECVLEKEHDGNCEVIEWQRLRRMF